jgi:hypothetical protein
LDVVRSREVDLASVETDEVGTPLATVRVLNGRSVGGRLNIKGESKSVRAGKEATRANERILTKTMSEFLSRPVMKEASATAPSRVDHRSRPQLGSP